MCSIISLHASPGVFLQQPWLDTSCACTLHCAPPLPKIYGQGVWNESWTVASPQWFGWLAPSYYFVAAYKVARFDVLCHVCSKIMENILNVFPTVIHPKTLHYVLRLPLHHGFPFFEPCYYLVFGLKHIHTYLVQEIVNEGEKIPCTSIVDRFYRPVYVGMHELHDLCGAGLCIRRECLPCLFALNTSFTCKQMHVALHRSHVHPTHHALKYFKLFALRCPNLLCQSFKECIFLVEHAKKLVLAPFITFVSN